MQLNREGGGIYASEESSLFGIQPQREKKVGAAQENVHMAEVDLILLSKSLDSFCTSYIIMVSP